MNPVFDHSTIRKLADCYQFAITETDRMKLEVVVSVTMNHQFFLRTAVRGYVHGKMR